MVKGEVISPGKKSSEVSQRINSAWKNMLARGQISIYLQMDVDKFKKELRINELSAEGKEDIAEYLRAVDELIGTSKNPS